MAVAVVVAFFVCWAPFHAQRLLVISVPADRNERSEIVNTIMMVSQGTGSCRPELGNHLHRGEKATPPDY